MTDKHNVRRTCRPKVDKMQQNLHYKHVKVLKSHIGGRVAYSRILALARLCDSARSAGAHSRMWEDAP
jgi:hypothetical protein